MSFLQRQPLGVVPPIDSGPLPELVWPTSTLTVLGEATSLTLRSWLFMLVPGVPGAMASPHVLKASSPGTAMTVTNFWSHYLAILPIECLSPMLV